MSVTLASYDCSASSVIPAYPPWSAAYAWIAGVA
jgi:hypothetical protein